MERIISWEGNRSLPNPYFNQSSGTPSILCIAATPNSVLPGPSELEIRRRLTLEEEGEVASTATDSSDKFTKTQYLLYGLDLEEQQ